MIINIFSYKKVKEIIHLEEYKRNWISVRDYGYEHLYSDLDNNGENILKVYFDDVTNFNIKHDLIHPIYKEIIKNRNFILFSNEQANQILDFAHKIYKSKETLNIHCWAGKSRSQAIGYVLNNYFNLFLENNKIDYIRNLEQCSRNFMPNPDVLKILNQTLYFIKD